MLFMNSFYTMNRQQYYEIEAEEVNIFGELREIALSDSILATITSSAKTVVDIGCGDGYMLYCIRKLYKPAKLFGVDLSFKRLKKTQKNVFAFVTQGEICKLPFPNASFDVVICSETLEHIDQYELALKELVRITKKKLIISVPNEETLIIDRCPDCNRHFYINDHKNSFDDKKLKSLLFKLDSSLRVKKVVKFRTIFSYNRSTVKWPRWMRIWLDQALVFFSPWLSFFKPSYLLIVVEKKYDVA